MDAVIAEGRFITSLLKRFASAENKRILSIFAKEIDFLHSQAENIEMSLKSFYDEWLIEIEEIYTTVPAKEIALELEEDDKERFKQELNERSSNSKRKIKITRSLFKFPPSNNSLTLRLAEQLANTQDLSIFEAKLVQVYIQKRWQNSFWFFGLDYAIVMVGLLVIFLHASFLRTPYILPLLLFTQGWNAAIQSIEIRNKKCAYFSDFWNYFDILRFVFAFTYFGVAFASTSSQFTRALLLTLLSFFQTVKAFHIFSLFQSTRVLLRIVIQIVKDMIPFMVFVLATTLAVSLLFTSATPDESLTDLTYTDYLMHVYRLDFGDFQSDNYSGLDFAIFILAILIVPLVFLNMLIAIMGDTFDRVKQEQGRRDFQEMAGLVYRCQTIAQTLCKRKRNNKWKYIFMYQDTKYQGEEAIDVWQGRIRGIKLEIEKSHKKQEEWQLRNEKENQEWKTQMEDWMKNQEKKHQENRVILTQILNTMKENSRDKNEIAPTELSLQN